MEPFFEQTFKWYEYLEVFLKNLDLGKGTVKEVS